MKKIFFTITLLSMLMYKSNAQDTLQEKLKSKILTSVYSGASFSNMLDDNNYTGIFIGIQNVIKNKHYITAECEYALNNNLKSLNLNGESDVVRNKTNFEICYGIPFLVSKHETVKLIWQAGFSIQNIYYQGERIGTQRDVGTFNFTGGIPIYSERKFWQAGIPIKIKIYMQSKYAGASFDLFANVSHYTDIGLRFTCYLGKLK